MHRSLIFAVSTILLVPFLYYAASPLPDVCARPAEGVNTICAGNIDSKDGEKCCWKVVGGEKGSYMVCDTCWRSTNEQGWTTTTCSPPTPAAAKGPLPGLETQDRLPAGGVFELPDNGTLSQNMSNSNDSSKTLAELQSDAEDETAEGSTEENNAEQEQDESEEESEDSNEEEEEEDE